MKRVAPLKKKEKSGKQGIPRSPKVRMSQHDVLHMGRSLYAKKRTLDSALALLKAPPAVEKGWLAIPDTKTAAPGPDYVKMLQDNYDAELKLARGALASVWGSKPVPFVVTADVTYSTTVTTGLANTGSDIKYADSVDAASLAALFDEYRITHARYEFAIYTPTPTIVLATSTLTAQSVAWMGFDPSDNTAATTPSDISNLEYHVSVYPRIEPNGVVAGTFVGCFGKLNGKPYVLAWRYKDDVALTGNGGAVGPGMWKATSGNTGTFPDGSIKLLYQSGETTVKVAIVGTQFRNLQFRNRT